MTVGAGLHFGVEYGHEVMAGELDSPAVDLSEHDQDEPGESKDSE